MTEGDHYLFAVGIADSFDLAIHDAVGMLAGQITTNVNSASSITISSSCVKGDLSGSTYFSNVVSTFTDVQLTDYHVLMIDKPNKKNKSYTAFVYISSAKVNEIIAEIKQAEKEATVERENKLKKDVAFYFDEGFRALYDIRIGDALKCFFSGYAISLNTDANIEWQKDTHPAEAVFSTLIDQTLNNIKIVCENQIEEKVNEDQTSYIKQLAFYYKNNNNTYRKITCLDFKYHNGNTFVGGPRVRDGVSIAELNYDLDNIHLHCIYNYEESETPPHIIEVLKNKRIKSFSSAEKIISLKTTKLINAEKQKDNSLSIAMPVNEEADPILSISNSCDTIRYETLQNTMVKIEEAVRGKSYSDVEPFFTQNGWDCFNKLICYGNASIIGTPEYKFIDFGSLTICQSITMQFRFRKNKQFVEKVNFRFNKDNLIESLAFSLTNVAQHDILDNEDWKRNSKLTLLTFMEDYQTAYALGRIDYLEGIFSENALIISGYKVLKKVHSDGIRLQGYTRFDTLTKSQYINRLRMHFKNKEYINLNFTQTDFAQAWSIEDFFGVRVRQEYFSSSYGDVGYLFLLVDLRGKDPIIHVRAWQEDKIPIDQLFSLKDVY